jgi:hypothetical protein
LRRNGYHIAIEILLFECNYRKRRVVGGRLHPPEYEESMMEKKNKEREQNMIYGVKELGTRDMTECVDRSESAKGSGGS